MLAEPRFLHNSFLHYGRGWAGVAALKVLEVSGKKVKY